MAKNDAGETELTFALEVLVAPEFSQFFHIPETELELGEELRLDCSATGNPKPQVRIIFLQTFHGQAEDLIRPSVAGINTLTS